MRISRSGLLIVIAIAIPFLVEARTVLAYVGVDLSGLGAAVLGIAVVAAIVLWAVAPRTDGTETERGADGGESR